MRLFVCAALAIAASVSAAAQAPVEDLIGRRIASVRVEVEGVSTDEIELADLIETRPGEPLDPRQVRESIAHLYGLGRFEDIRVHGVEVEGGVALRYELLPVHSVRRIAFAGRQALSDGQLRRAVEERFGASPSAARRSEVAAHLEQVYRDHGYLQARITSRLDVQQGADRTTLVFEIEAGPRVRVTEVVPEGNAPGGLGEALRELDLERGEPYERDRVESRLADYVAGLRRRGYYEAQGDHRLVASDDGLTGRLVITLDAGPHITLVFEGDPVPPRVRSELVPIQREASIDEDLLEDATHGLQEHFRRLGYRDAAAVYTKEPRDGELAIVFRVDRGRQYVVRRIAISGNDSVPFAEIAALLRLREGEPFSEALLEADEEAITEAYHRRGFASASVTPRTETDPDAAPVPVDVTLAIAEGRRTIVESVTIAGNEAFDAATLQSVLASREGEAFYPPQLARDRDTLAAGYQNAGYRSASVTPQVSFNEDRTRAAVRFDIDERERTFVEHIIIIGNERTSRETIRREMTLGPGDPLGYEALAESQRRISALGLFRRVQIRELDHGAGGRRDLVVTVEEAPATTLGYGGGLEMSRRLVRPVDGSAPQERFEVAPRGFFEVGRRNLFGRNRSINLFTRLSLRLRDEPMATRDGEEPATDFNEYRVLGTYRQPRFWAGSDLLATAFVEQGARTSFDFNRRGTRLEVGRRFGRILSGSARYSLDRTEVFNERFVEAEDELLIDRLFPQVRLSIVSGALIRDTRDDPLGPASGSLVGLDGEVAGRSIGSEVGFIKGFFQAFTYRRLPGRLGVVFAAGGRLGLADGFARVVPRLDAGGQPVLDGEGRPIVDRIDDLPASQRFFAGGDTTVRGFSLDRLGAAATLDQNGFPRGGNAVMILNAELRIPVWRDLGAVTFVDAGNVFARVPDFAPSDLRASAGFGLRYRSPIGPLRMDLGFKLGDRQRPGGELERRTALHISLGQAF